MPQIYPLVLKVQRQTRVMFQKLKKHMALSELALHSWHILLQQLHWHSDTRKLKIPSTTFCGCLENTLTRDHEQEM